MCVSPLYVFIVMVSCYFGKHGFDYFGCGEDNNALNLYTS